MKRFAFALAATFVLALAGPALADPIIIKAAQIARAGLSHVAERCRILPLSARSQGKEPN